MSVNPKLILCIGDSIGMPRDGVIYAETWFYLLSENFKEHHFIYSFKRALTTDELINKDFLEFINPNYVVLQIGIVDCAPRYFRKGSFVEIFVNKLPKLLRDNFWKIKKKISQRKKNFSYVSEHKYKENIISYIDRCMKLGIEKVFILPIILPGTKMIKSNPQIVEQLNRYNLILNEVELIYEKVHLIKFNLPFTESDFVDDGYHLNSSGQKIVGRSLIDNLSLFI